MAPQSKEKLLYENDDLDLVDSFSKKEKVPEKLAAQARSNQTLLSFLREVMKLRGSKLGCSEGGCGACSVMISKKDPNTNKVKHLAVNACLMPALAADGCHVTTVEGIGSVKGGLHPVQKAMTDLHGSQCGFCTPGIIVAIYSLFAVDHPSAKHIEEHLDGNLCRCTGYRPIWDAARTLCDDAEELVKGPCGTACRECPEREECEQDCNVEDKAAAEDTKDSVKSCSATKLSLKKEFEEGKTNWMDQPNQMFPKDLMDENSDVSISLSKPLMIVDQVEYQGSGTWFKPTTFEQLLSLLKEFGEDGQGGYKVVVGNTEVGIEMRFKHSIYPRLISPAESVESIFDFSVTPETITIGGCTPLSHVQHEAAATAAKDARFTRTTMPMHDMLRWFASTQIRNVACLGGNLVTASPISDMNPLLASFGASLVISKLSGGEISRRKVPVPAFFLSYRRVNIEPGEIVESVEVPVLNKYFDYVKPFKQARRREDDISIVTSGMHIRVVPKDGAFFIEHAALAFGGMAPTTTMAKATAEVLIGSEFSRSTFDKAQEALMKEFNLPEGVPGGQAAYRITLAASFLQKMYFAVAVDLKADVEAIAADATAAAQFPSPLPSVVALEGDETSGLDNFLSATKPTLVGVQKYPAPKVAVGLEKEILPDATIAGANSASAVGKPSVHQSGSLHCTGEALYCDDIPEPSGTLHGSLILSTACGCVFEKLDKEAALAIPGVVGVFTSEDIDVLGGKNLWGPIAKDEHVFHPAGEKIRTVGQVLGVVVGETLESAELGAREAKVSYGPVEDKIVLTIEEAIAAGSYFEGTRHSLTRGDVSVIDGLKDAKDFEGTPKVGDIVKVSGSYSTGAQEHFYLETNATLAVPSESDTNLTIYCSTQAATKTQTYCASSTGTPASKVVCKVKRLGGGFGGKETRSVFISCAAAVAAKRTGRAVRLTLPRNQDMLISGHRHAFVSKYSASAEITEEGPKLVAMDIHLYNNGGYSLDLSGPVSDRAVFHSDNVYFFPNFRVEGVACKTHQASHTAYRGFGGPQGMAPAEHVMEHLAHVCDIDVGAFRRLNMYKEGQATHFGQILGEKQSGKWNVPRMWDKLWTELDIDKRHNEIEEFNKKNKYLKRGATLLPTKFGVAFTAKYMNQGGALVHLYVDGTVLVSHGGTEMGQGLHTKVCQVAAQAFGIPIEMVYVNETATDKVANTIPTAASMSTDLYGMCTLDACRQIVKRLEPYREKLGPEASLKSIAFAAHMDRVDLSAHGFFIPADDRVGFDFTVEKPADYPADKPENSWKGNPFNYFTQGVAYTEVEVDFLTGNHRTLISEVLVDVGSSVNPAIDIGQIEGAFTQGMGWSTIEEVVYADEDHKWVRPYGTMFTQGPGTYKIPAFNDQPEIFNVSLMEGVDNPFAVHSSKAVGEPPFYLGASVFYAIKDAVRRARETPGYFEFRMPATSERIRMSVNDEISMKAKKQVIGDSGRDAAQYQVQGSF
ncbi:MAG: hypothetical protein SGBAC_005084 [Bacillariaceae sp.]